MATEITITVKNVDPILRKLKSDMFDSALQRLIEDATRLAHREATDNMVRDTGATITSMQSEVRPLQGRVFSTSMSAVVMEEGRRPGARMPPPNALRGWAGRKGFGTDPGSLFVLARSIGRRGRKGRFFMQKAAEKVRQALPRLAQDAANSIEAEWGR